MLGVRLLGLLNTLLEELLCILLGVYERLLGPPTLTDELLLILICRSVPLSRDVLAPLEEIIYSFFLLWIRLQ